VYTGTVSLGWALVLVVVSFVRGVSVRLIEFPTVYELGVPMREQKEILKLKSGQASYFCIVRSAAVHFGKLYFSARLLSEWDCD